MDRAAGCQTGRWCADNAVSLEQCTKALRAGQEIHLAERWERGGGEDLSERELRKEKSGCGGGEGSGTRACMDIWKSRDIIDPQTEH